VITNRVLLRGEELTGFCCFFQRLFGPVLSRGVDEFFLLNTGPQIPARDEAAATAAKSSAKTTASSATSFRRATAELYVMCRSDIQSAGDALIGTDDQALLSRRFV